VNLRVIGCNFRTATVELREKLAFDNAKRERALLELNARYGCECVLLSTCNRVELTVGGGIEDVPFDIPMAAEFLGEVHGLPAKDIQPLLYDHPREAAVKHLARVTGSLDSLIVGEGQIAGQVKEAFETSLRLGTTGPLLNTLFNHTLRVAKRIRTETGIAVGHVSVSSVAVDYVKQVFDTFHDKTVLIIGAGKMARLTLKHLQSLQPKQILVTNRSLPKAVEVAETCGGTPVPWEELDDALAKADIALSTTGAAEPIMPRKRFVEKVLPKRNKGTLVVLDIAVPRDFDPAIHDGDRVCLFNIDDLVRIRDQTIAQRKKYLAPAEAIVNAEVKKFVDEWNRRKSGPVIQQLRQEVDRVRTAIMEPLMGKLNGKLSVAEREQIEGAFRLFQNKILHGPISAINDASAEGESRRMLEAVQKLFGLKGV
jgi:glutamyl-tRNA reductase